MPLIGDPVSQCLDGGQVGIESAGRQVAFAKGIQGGQDAIGGQIDGEFDPREVDDPASIVLGLGNVLGVLPFLG